MGILAGLGLLLELSAVVGFILSGAPAAVPPPAPKAIRASQTLLEKLIWTYSRGYPALEPAFAENLNYLRPLAVVEQYRKLVTFLYEVKKKAEHAFLSVWNQLGPLLTGHVNAIYKLAMETTGWQLGVAQEWDSVVFLKDLGHNKEATCKEVSSSIQKLCFMIDSFRSLYCQTEDLKKHVEQLIELVQSESKHLLGHGEFLSVLNSELNQSQKGHMREPGLVRQDGDGQGSKCQNSHGDRMVKDLDLIKSNLK